MATREIKATLALDGGKKFKQELDDAQRGLRAMRAELKAETAAFTDNGSAQKKNEATARSLRNQIDQQKKIVTALEKAVWESTKDYGENSKATDGLRIKLANARVELAKMTAEEQEVTSATKEMKSGFDSLYDNLSDGAPKAAQAFKTGMSAIKTAAAATVAAISAGAVAAGNAVYSAEVATASYADDVLTQSTVTGISTSDLQQMLYAEEKTDVKADDIISSMKKLRLNMDSGSEDIANAFLTLGVRATDDQGEYRDAGDLFWEIIDQYSTPGTIANKQSQTERENMLNLLFGKGYSDLAPLIANGGSEWYWEIAGQASEHDVLIDDETLEKYGHLSDVLSDINANSQGARNALSDIFLNDTTTFAEGVEGVTRHFNKWISGEEGTEPMLKEVQKMFEGVTGIVETGTAKINELIGGLQASDNETIKGIGDALGGLQEGFEWIVNNSGEIATDLAAIFAVFKSSELLGPLGTFFLGIPTAIATWGGGQRKYHAERFLDEEEYVQAAEYDTSERDDLAAWIRLQNLGKKWQSEGRLDADYEGLQADIAEIEKNYKGGILNTDLGSRYWNYVNETQNTMDFLPELESVLGGVESTISTGDMDTLASKVATAVARGISSMQITLDGTAVGQATSQYIASELEGVGGIGP